MGGPAGCLLNASDVSGEVAKDLASRLGVTSLFVRGTVSLPEVRSKAPVPSGDGRTPGLELGDDDSALRSALGAARAAGLDPYVVVGNPLVGLPGWSDLLAVDSGGRSAKDVDAERPTLCPNRPKLLKWLAAAAAELAKTYRPTGVLLEDFSLGSAGKVEPLFTCWCDTCQVRIGELGYDADRIRLALQGARSKLEGLGPAAAGARGLGIGQFVEAIGYDTGLLDWLNFRADSVSACLYEVRQALAGVDASLRVWVLGKSPTAAMLAGQRRADALRDTTLADVYAPVICGAGSDALATIAGHAGLINNSLEEPDESAAVALSARLHGYDGVPVPATIEELAASPGAELVTASAERELQLTMAAGGEVPRWPAIDVSGLSGELVAQVAERVGESEAEGLLYIGVPH